MPRDVHLRKIFALAEATDRLVTRSALLEAGLHSDYVARKVRSGALTRVLDGVYGVGLCQLTQRQLFRSGLLFSGPTSGLSGFSAGEQRAVVRPFLGRATIATSRPKIATRVDTLVPMSNRRPGTITFESTTDRRFVECDGLQTVPVPRMLIEIAARGGRRAAERAWRETDFRRLLNADEIRRELRTTRRPGAPILRALTDTLPPPVDGTIDVRSRDEIAFLELVRRAGIEEPEVNVPMTIAGAFYVADFFWRALGLVVEVDDPSHRSDVASGRDRIRDVEFFVAGLDVMRFETHRLRSEPAVCMRQLAAGVERQRARVAIAVLPSR